MDEQPGGNGSSSHDGDKDPTGSRKYTTAGTIWKGKQRQPFQPPQRRARHQCLPMPGNVHVPPASLFPKESLSRLQRERASSRDEASNDNRPQPEYLPLQQNNDRAVNPATAPPPPPPPPPQPAEEGSSSSSRYLPYLHENWRNMVVRPDREIASSDDDSNVKHLRGLGVKSLHNLASYPNPNQAGAKKVLYPKHSDDSFSRQTSQQRGIPLASPPSPPRYPAAHAPTSLSGRGHHADPQSSYRAERQDSGTSHALLETIGPCHQRNVEYSYSTLASGPGAPRPLTAGPPGQRLYTAPRLNISAQEQRNALREDTDIEKIVADDPSVLREFREILARHRQRQHDRLHRQMSSVSPQLTRDKPAAAPGTEPKTLQDLCETSCIDTKISPQEAIRRIRERQNLRNSPPSDADVAASCAFPSPCRQPWEPGTYRRTEDSLAEHNQRVARLFYAGGLDVQRYLEQHALFSKSDPSDENSTSGSGSATDDSRGTHRVSVRDAFEPLLNMLLPSLDWMLEEVDHPHQYRAPQ